MNNTPLLSATSALSEGEVIAEKLEKLLRRSYCGEVIAEKLLRRSYCGEVIAEKLLRRSYCGEVIAEKLLRRSYCGEVIAEKLLRRSYCGEVIAEKLLRRSYCGEVIAEKLLRRSYCGEVITGYKLTWSYSPAETTKNQFCASLYASYSKNLKSSAVDVSLPEIFLRLHSLWSINAGWNILYLLMGHTANFA